MLGSQRALSNRLQTGVAGVAVGQIIFSAKSPGPNFAICQGRAVSVGASFPSPDRQFTSFALRSAATNNAVGGIAYGNGVFVAVGSSGTVRTSTDGDTWTPQAPNAVIPNTLTLVGIAYADGLFVAIASQGHIFTSPDGVNWTYRYIAAFALTAIAAGFSNGTRIFVIVAAGQNYTISSTDGVTWTPKAQPNFNAGLVAYGNGIFVVVNTAAGTAYWSADGINYSAQGFSLPSSGNAGIAFGRGVFVATCSNQLAYSVDGKAWTGSGSLTGEAIASVSFAQGFFLAPSLSLGYAVSDDGRSWNSYSSPLDAIRTMASNGTRVVGGMANGAIYSGSSNRKSVFTTPNIQPFYSADGSIMDAYMKVAA